MRKKAVCRDLLLAVWNGDSKIMQPLRTSNGTVRDRETISTDLGGHFTK